MGITVSNRMSGTSAPVRTGGDRGHSALRLGQGGKGRGTGPYPWCGDPPAELRVAFEQAASNAAGRPERSAARGSAAANREASATEVAPLRAADAMARAAGLRSVETESGYELGSAQPVEIAGRVTQP